MAEQERQRVEQRARESEEWWRNYHQLESERFEVTLPCLVREVIELPLVPRAAPPSA